MQLLTLASSAHFSFRCLLWCHLSDCLCTQRRKRGSNCTTPANTTKMMSVLLCSRVQPAASRSATCTSISARTNVNHTTTFQLNSSHKSVTHKITTPNFTQIRHSSSFWAGKGIVDPKEVRLSYLADNKGARKKVWWRCCTDLVIFVAYLFVLVQANWSWYGIRQRQNSGYVVCLCFKSWLPQ